MEEEIQNQLIQSIAQNLITKFPNVFKNYFTILPDYPNMAPDIEEEAKEKYTDYITENNLSVNLEFHEFLERYKMLSLQSEAEIQETSNICPKVVYDAEINKYLPKTTILPPIRKRKEECNPYKFILEKKQNGNFYNIQFDEDIDYYMNNFEENNDLIADQAIRKIARIISILNNSCSFQILNIYSERAMR